MKRRLLRAALVGFLLAAAGVLGVASGAVPIQASSGHWGITEALLQFAKERSVATHTLGGEPLDLSEPWLALKGAGHYHTGCQPCHGDPATNYFPRVVQGTTPHPPRLQDRVKIYQPDELFYIVKHGIKFTGMPAWPSLERDDEVRAIVAFLLVYPDLEPAAYDSLVHGDARTNDLAGLSVPAESAPPPRIVVSNCARCHGVDGHGRGNAAFPKLAGQRPEYVAGAMRAYAAGERHSGIMEPIAAALDDDTVREIADYYAALPAIGPYGSEQVDPARVALGLTIATIGTPDRSVPACAGCHGPGNQPRRAEYPRLEGQYADYLLLQLRLFKANKRGGSAFAHVMHEVADDLDEAQMKAAAAFYASLAPEAR